MNRFPALRGSKAWVFLFFLWFLWFLSFTSRAIFAPLLPLIEDEFAIRHATASSIFAYISVGYSLSLFLSGLWGGWVGYKKAITVSMLLTSAVFGMIPWVGSFSTLRSLSFIVGLAAGIYLPSILPLLTAYYAEKDWGRAIVIHDSGAPFSIFAAPLICLFLLPFVSWRGILALLGGIMFAGGVLFYFSGPEVKRPQGAQGRFRDLLRRKSLWIIGAIWIFASGCNLGLYFIFPLYLTKELSMDGDTANTIFSISRLGGIAVVLTAGYFIDRFSLKKGIFWVLLLTGLLTMALATRQVGWMRILLFLQASIAIGFFPLTFVLISRIFEAERRGEATGFIVTMGVIVGIGLMPYLLGLCGDYLSFRLGIVLLGILTALSSSLLYLLPGPK